MKTIFDLIGLSHRVSQHSDYYVSIQYFGSIDSYHLWLHERETHNIIWDTAVKLEGDSCEYWSNTQDAYEKLKEYWP